MSKIDQLKRLWNQGGCSLEIYNAPKDAQTFDKMIVIFADERSDYQALAGLPPGKPSGRRIIRRVNLYNSVTDMIEGEF